ncbi:MAG: hypothetical protein SVX43_02795 [Cyanobacteriota bacterium]|nr:hypothetical protein [Cyanobacteriota bacterium]
MFNLPKLSVKFLNPYQWLYRAKVISLILALSLSFLGVIALGFISQESNAGADVGVERETSVFCQYLTGEAIEVDGISFKTLVPKTVWRIPAREEGAYTPVKLGARIKNNSAEAYRFTRFSLRAEIVRLDRFMQRKSIGHPVRLSEPDNSLAPLLKPGESVEFILDGRLYWQDDQLNLDIRDGSGWTFRIWPLSLEENLLRFIHKRELPEVTVYNPNQNIIQGLWAGQAITNFVRILLVED